VHRSVRTFLPVVGDGEAVAAAFCDDPQRWLPAARHEGPERFTFVVHAGALTRTVHARIGGPWQAGSTRWRTFAWDLAPIEGDLPPLDRLLPSLDGELGLHLEGPERSTLVLDARYQPPGGPLGAAVDSVALHRVARRTVERFLEETAARLASEALLIADGSAVSPARDAPHHHGAEPVGT
jgi:hypothetical protein